MDSTRRKGNTMKKTAEEKNKKFVLEAFDTLFSKRDYAAAERFCRHVNIHNTALISRPAARASSISSRALRQS
jgi:hypothetical protein